jgi:hypothetical protein
MSSSHLYRSLCRGAIKLSTIEKAFAKAGCYDSGEMNFKQFQQVLELFQKSVDYSKLDSREFDEMNAKPSKNKSRGNSAIIEDDGGYDIDSGATG